MCVFVCVLSVLYIHDYKVVFQHITHTHKRARMCVFNVENLSCNHGCTEHLNLLKTTLSFDSYHLPYRLPACSSFVLEFSLFFRLATTYRAVIYIFKNLLGNTQRW